MKLKVPDELVRIDLHVHTSRGSPCAELHNPFTIPETMEETDLQGIVVTEHNMMWSLEEIKSLNSGLKNRKIYRGMEVSSGNFHFIIIGIEKTEDIYAGIHLLTLIDIVNAQGGVVILAHPYSGIPRNEAILIPSGVSAIEIMSTVTRQEDSIRALELCHQNNLISVAGSDAHCAKKVGQYYTLFPYLPDNEKELAAMICSGECILPIKQN